MVQKQDKWAAEIAQLKLPKITEQLALNSWKEHNHSVICLHLRSKFRYLNSLFSQQILYKSFNRLKINNDIKLTILEDDDPSHLTPMELKKQIYKKQILKLYRDISNDIDVKKICEIFDANLDIDSLQFI